MGLFSVGSHDVAQRDHSFTGSGLSQSDAVAGVDAHVRVMEQSVDGAAKGEGSPAPIMNAVNKEAADLALDQFGAAYGAKYPKAVHKVLTDREVLLAHFDFPVEHWIHLRTTTSSSQPAHGPTAEHGSRSAGLAMAYKTAGRSPGSLALRERAPPGRTRSR